MWYLGPWLSPIHNNLTMTFILSPSYLQVLVVLPPTFCPFLSIGVSYPRSYPRTLLDVALVLNSLFCIVTSENICNVLVYVCVCTLRIKPVVSCILHWVTSWPSTVCGFAQASWIPCDSSPHTPSSFHLFRATFNWFFSNVNKLDTGVRILMNYKPWEAISLWFQP